MIIINTIQRNTKIKLVALFLFVGVSAHAGNIVVEKAIATPQNDTEVGNTEVLKERALKNAIESALLKHSGAVISNQRSDGSHSKEQIVIQGGEVKETVKNDHKYDRSTHIQTTGQAKVVEIISESFVGDDYRIEVKLDITNRSDNLKNINAGYFWLRAGKPSISIDLVEQSGRYETSLEHSTTSYIYDNFSKNGINLVDVDRPKYVLSVKQLFNTTESHEYNTYTTHCELIYEIINTSSSIIIFTDKAKNGPVPGFTSDQAHKDCISSIAPEATKNVITRFAEIFDLSWREGDFYHVSISLFSGDQVSEALEAVKSTFSLEGYQNLRYSNRLLSLEVQFKGNSQALISSLESSFDYTSCKLLLRTSNDERMNFECHPVIN